MKETNQTGIVRGRWGWIPVLLCLLLATGCAWRIVPPADVRNPAPVIVTDYGRHTRLALPEGESGMVEYGFGEWNFYALRKTGPISSIRALSGFGQPTLARRRLPRFEGEEAFWRTAGGRRSAFVYAEKERVRELRQILEATWRVNLNADRYHSWNGLEFVRYEGTYHLFRNSNHRTATWLRALGFEVRGVVFLSNFRVLEIANGVGANDGNPP